jgi:hypothetical protein
MILSHTHVQGFIFVPVREDITNHPYIAQHFWRPTAEEVEEHLPLIQNDTSRMRPREYTIAGVDLQGNTMIRLNGPRPDSNNPVYRTTVFISKVIRGESSKNTFCISSCVCTPSTDVFKVHHTLVVLTH